MNPRHSSPLSLYPSVRSRSTDLPPPAKSEKIRHRLNPHGDVRVRRQWYPLARTCSTAPITTVTTSSDSHEAGGARRRVDAGGRIGTIIMNWVEMRVIHGIRPPGSTSPCTHSRHTSLSPTDPGRDGDRPSTKDTIRPRARQYPCPRPSVAG